MMNNIKGIISGGIFTKEGKKVRDIFLFNYDTIEGRLSTDFSSQCYKVDELTVLVSNPSLIHRIYQGTMVKVPLFPDEPMFLPDSFEIKGSANNSSFAISYNEGVNWWTWEGSELVAVSFSTAEELSANGMSLSELNSISTAAHNSKYIDHVVLAMTPNGEDYIEGYDMIMRYSSSKSDSSATRWIGDIKSNSRYTFIRTPISTNKTVISNTTYYDISISNIGGLSNLVVTNICAENSTNTKLATFANVNLVVEPDHVLIGKYRLIRDIRNVVLDQIGVNTKTILLGTATPTYTNGAFSVSLSNFSGMTLLGNSGYNAPTVNSSIFPVIANMDLRVQQMSRTVVLPSDRQKDHNEINSGWSVTSNGHVSISSSDTEKMSGFNHFPVYLRFQMLNTGTATDTAYLPYIQHRPDSLFSSRLSYLSVNTGSLFHLDFLRDPKNPLPWNYIEYYNVGVSSEVPSQSVNVFSDVIVETFTNKVIIRRFSGDQLFKLSALPGETFKLAWANRSDPSGRCLYVVSNDSVTGDTLLSSIPVSFVFDPISHIISVSTNGDLSERYFLGNVSDPDSEYAMVAKDLLDLHQALGGSESPSAILTAMKTSEKLYGGYASNTLDGPINSGSTLYDQKWGALNMSLGGDASATTNGANHVVNFVTSGYGYTNEISDNLNRRQALKPDPFVSFNVEATETLASVPLQIDDIWVNTNLSNELSIGTDVGWPNLMNIESSYGWFIGGNSANDISRLSFADDTTDMIARGSTSYNRTYHGACFRSMGVWMAGGTESSGTMEKYDLTSDTSNSLERGSLATPMTKGDGHSGDAQYGHFFNRFGNTPVQSMDFDNDTVSTIPRVSLPTASPADLKDSSMLLYDEESIYWGYPVNNWVTTGSGIYHGSVNILEILHSNDTAITNNTLVTSDTTGGISGLFGHIYNNSDFGWFSQYSALDFAECGSGIHFKRLNKNLSIITVDTRTTGVGSVTACSGADSFSNRKTSMNNNNYGWSLRNQSEASQRKDLNNDTMSFTSRATPPTDKRNAAGCSDWLVSNAKPLSANTRIGTYTPNVKTSLGLITAGRVTLGIQGNTVQVAPRKDKNDSKPLGWLSIGSKIVPNTGYDTIGVHTISDPFKGQLSDIHVGSVMSLEGSFRHLPYMYNLRDVQTFVSTHTIPSTFTFIIEGHNSKITHYFIDTANSNAITEINSGNLGSVTPINVTELNAVLSDMKSFFNPRARIGLVTYDMEYTSGHKVSKTFVKVRKTVKALHARAYGMDSSGNYSETNASLNSRFVTRMFCYNGRGIWVPKGTAQEYSVIEDIINNRKITGISSSHTFDNISISENPAGFTCFVDRSTSTTCDRDFIWIGKDDRRYCTKIETHATGYSHVSIGTYDIWDDTWSIQTCLVNPDNTLWSDKSREYYSDPGDRVICIPTLNKVAGGSIGSTVDRRGFFQLSISDDGKMDPTKCFPEIVPAKYQLITSTSPFNWKNMSWSFSNGSSAPHFSIGDIFSTALLGYYGAALDNWQILNSFNLMMHCKADITDYRAEKSVSVDVSSEMRGRVGEIDVESSLITEPETDSKFFLY